MKIARYYFYLNENSFYKWTKCPKCDTKTKVRKFCLMVNYHDKARGFLRMLSLNKSCKYCTSCDLIIAQKEELDPLMEQFVVSFDVPFQAKYSFAFGTMERKDWAKNQKVPMLPNEVFKLTAPFKDIWEFEIQPAGWYYDG